VIVRSHFEFFDEEHVFAKLGRSAYEEFVDTSDYIWKAPRLIDTEKKAEIEKLESYYPLTGDLEKDNESKRLRKMR
jgi:hypothetical protein